MATFSDYSLKRLDTCDDELQIVFNRVIIRFDCRVLWGKRGKEDQDRAFHDGFSHCPYPESPHNTEPKSNAADVVPFPIDWKDIERFKRFGFFVLGTAHGMGILLKWGADWNMNLNTADESWRDYAHFEVVRENNQ